MKRLLIACLMLGAVLPAHADQNPQLPTVQQKATMNGSFAVPPGLGYNPRRQGCLVQNNGTHTLFVFFGGATAPADTTTSWQITAGNTISCTIGGQKNAVDNVWLEGTNADVVVYSYQ